MSIKAWPFLVSRNAVFDYRVVVAPQYMIENKAVSLIAKVADGEVTPPMSAIRREVHHPNPDIGDVSFIFRIMEANNQDVGLEGNETLKDSYGRSIRLIEGFIVKGQRAEIGDILVTEDDLLKASQTMREDYQAFWSETEFSSIPTIKSSIPLDLPLDDSSRRSDPQKILKLKDIEPYTVKLKVSTDLKHPETVSSQTDDLSPLPPKTKKQWVDEGDQLAARGLYEKAQLAARGLYEKAQPAARGLYEKAQPAARGLYEKAQPAARSLFEEALNAYKQAILLPSEANRRDDAPAHRGKGDIFFYQKKYNDAEREYNEALDCDSRYALAYNGKGLVSSQRGKSKEAIRFYEQAIECDPNCALAYANKGFALNDKGVRDKAFEDAVAAYDRLLHDEEKAFLYYYKSIALRELGSKREDDVRIAEKNASRLWGY